MNKTLRNILIAIPVILGAAVVLSVTGSNAVNPTVEVNDSDINEVLQNWNDTGAPMPIPIVTDDIYQKAEIVPYLNEGTGLWGYLCKNNERVIEPKFVKAGAFYSELAPVQLKENGKIGFINQKGEVVKKPFIDYIEEVSVEDNMMIVRIGDKYGMINLEGEIIEEINYDSIDGLKQSKGYSK